MRCPCGGAITDYSQSAKDIDPYFKSQFDVEMPGHRKPVLILPESERMTEFKFLPWVRFEPTTS